MVKYIKNKEGTRCIITINKIKRTAMLEIFSWGEIEVPIRKGTRKFDSIEEFENNCIENGYRAVLFDPKTCRFRSNCPECTMGQVCSLSRV